MSNTAKPIPRDTLELLERNPTFFEGMEYKEAAWQRPHRLTFVLANPRSGSTLLMRLMNMACLSFMVGDRPKGFFEGLVKMHQALDDEQRGQFGHLIVAEEKRQFFDEYRGTSRARERYLFKMVAALIFGDHNFKSAYAKSTILGFGNHLVVPFVTMLRDLYDGDPNTKLKIVFLRRPHDEIIHSLQTREGPGQEEAIKDPGLVRRLLELQDDQFKQAYELGDPKITYEQLKTDTVTCLNKLNPLYQPNLRALESIMSIKIR